MAFKSFLLIALMTVARGGVIGASVVAPAVVAKVSDATIDPNPSYSYAYDVQDTLTGDSKSQVESRANGIVKGQYTVADPDGTRRIVDYYADPIHGFNAVVRRAPLAVAAPVVAKAVATPLVASPPVAVAPGIGRVAAPYAAPLAVAPGVAGVAAPYASAPLAVAPRVSSPYLAAPAALGLAPGFPAAPLLANPASLPLTAAPFARAAAPYPYLL